MQFEVHTIGAAAQLTAIFNAVAAVVGDGSFATALRLVGLISLVWIILQVAFSGQWANVGRWFILFIAFNYVALGIKATVVVLDKTRPTAAVFIDNVPFGLAFFASISSTPGFYLTDIMETAFQVADPEYGEVSYTKHGFVFGAKIIEEATTWRITNARFAMNMREMLQQCVLPRILHDRRIQLDELKTSTDLWSYIQDRGQSLLISFTYRDGTANSPRIETCTDGIDLLNTQWNKEIDDAKEIFGIQMLSAKGVDAALAPAVLSAALENSHTFIVGASKTSATIMRQAMIVNAIRDAGQLTPGAVRSAYQTTRADQITSNVYKTTGQQAAKWVPLMRIVFEALYYGVFPIALLLFFTPSGTAIARNYFLGFVWLQSWPILYAVLNLIIMLDASQETQAALSGSSGLSLVTQGGVTASLRGVSEMASNLSMSIPFLSLIIVAGVSQASRLATATLAPTQSAAATAAEETTTGNISLGNATHGNTSLDNHSSNNLAANTWDRNIRHDAGMASFRTTAGTVETTTGDGRQTTDMSVSASSGNALSAAMNKSLASRYSAAATDAHNQSQTEADSRVKHIGASLQHLSSETDRNAFLARVEKSHGADQASEVSDAFRILDAAQSAERDTTTLSGQAQASIDGRINLSDTIAIGFGAGGGISKANASEDLTSEQKELNNAVSTVMRHAVSAVKADSSSDEKLFSNETADSITQAASADLRYTQETNRAQSLSQTAESITSQDSALSVNELDKLATFIGNHSDAPPELAHKSTGERLDWFANADSATRDTLWDQYLNTQHATLGLHPTRLDDIDHEGAFKAHSKTIQEGHDSAVGARADALNSTREDRRVLTPVQEYSVDNAENAIGGTDEQIFQGRRRLFEQTRKP